MKNIFLLFLLVSCKSSIFIKNDYFISNDCTFYCNDSLPLYLKLSGEYNFFHYDKPVFGTLNKNKTSKKIRNEILSYKNKLNTEKLILYGKSVLNERNTIFITLLDSVDLNKFESGVHDNKKYYHKIYHDNKFKNLENIFPYKDKFVYVFEKSIINEHNYYSENKQKNDSIYLNKTIGFTTLTDKPKPVSPYDYLFNDFFNNNNYSAYQKLISNKYNYKSQEELHEYYQALLTLLSFANEFRLLEKNELLWKKNLKNKKKKYELVYENFKITNLIKENQLVMINESHHHAEHRFFLGSLLSEFKVKNFKYLAVEGIQNDSINKRGYPIVSDGVYVNEPFFANMLREAKRLNYEIISYDKPREKKRDSLAANEIFSKTFEKNQLAKVIIYVGYEHINENPILKNPWLAYYFLNNYKINPLTISQTNTIFTFNNLKKKNKIQLIKNSDFKIVSDFTIYNGINPETCYNCFEKNKHRNYKYQFKGESNSLLVYYTEEFLNQKNKAIPTMVKKNKNKKSVKLNICTGNYVFCEQNIKGEIIYTKEIIIN